MPSVIGVLNTSAIPITANGLVTFGETGRFRAPSKGGFGKAVFICPERYSAAGSSWPMIRAKAQENPVTAALGW